MNKLVTTTSSIIYSLIIALILLSSCSNDDDGTPNNQITIPDANFEQALIDLGYDTNGLNGNILRTEAEALTSLNLGNKNISSLVGIEGFINLIELYCDDNSLTTVDISQNSLLKKLNFYDNQLTNLDVSNNTSLEALFCSRNSLTSLDMSNNTSLTTIDCSSNNLTTIDASQNPMLKRVRFNNNQLTALNIKNGFNVDIINFTAINNPNLACIEVDNPNLSSFIWSDFIDPQTTFLVNCN